MHVNRFIYFEYLPSINFARKKRHGTWFLGNHYSSRTTPTNCGATVICVNCFDTDHYGIRRKRKTLLLNAPVKTDIKQTSEKSHRKGTNNLLIYSNIEQYNTLHNNFYLYKILNWVIIIVIFPQDCLFFFITFMNTNNFSVHS